MAYEIIDLNQQTDGGQTVTVAYEQEEGDGLYLVQPEGLWEDPTAELPPVTLEELNEVATTVLGTVNNIAPKVVAVGEANAGKIDRTLPCHHPLRASLSATAASFRGVGPAYLGDGVAVPGLNRLRAKLSLYPQYELTVKFGRHPYWLVANDYIPLTSVPYYKPLDGSLVTVNVAWEWLRYCTRTQVPTNESIDSQFGAMKLKTETGGATPPNNTQYAASPFVPLQNQTIEVTWYRVPYRYLFEHEGKRPYLTRFVNCVNQNLWWGYPAGSLLYLGCTPSTPYAAPGFPIDGTGIDQYSLCDIKLNFLYTTREGTDVPNSANALLTNKNRIAAGHNLLPWFKDRSFRYAVFEDGNKPTFDSFEFGLFFTDPMLTQPENL